MVVFWMDLNADHVAFAHINGLKIQSFLSRIELWLDLETERL